MRKFFKLMLTLTLMSAFCASAFAAPQFFEAEGIFVISNNDDKTHANYFAVEDAKRLALEQAGAYLKSVAKASNGQLSVSDIAAIASNVIKLEELINEKTTLNNGVASLAVKARFVIDSDDLQKKIETLQQSGKKQLEIAKMAALQKRYAALVAANNRLKSELARTTDPKVKEQLLVKTKETANQLNATLWLDKGTEYLDAKNFDSAIEAYNKTIDLDPQYAEVYNRRGNAYSGKRQYDLAIADYSEAIILNPEFAYAYNNRGISYGRKEQYDLAIADCSKAISLNPQYASPYSNRGNAYLRTKQYDLAIADCSKAIKLAPQLVYPYLIRGFSYYYKEQYDLALADINKASELDPQNEKLKNIRNLWRVKLIEKVF